MKVFRYVIFPSLLVTVFFIAYRTSDYKGLRRWIISFKVAVIVAVSLVGASLASSENNSFFSENNQIHHERVYSSNQEFDLLNEDNGAIFW